MLQEEVAIEFRTEIQDYIERTNKVGERVKIRRGGHRKPLER